MVRAADKNGEKGAVFRQAEVHQLAPDSVTTLPRSRSGWEYAYFSPCLHP
jgi:hypothetical protein